MRIGLYFGSFNPVHNSHIDIIRKVLKNKIVDEVWIVPCKNHAYDKDLAPINDRLRMLAMSINGLDRSRKNMPVRIDLTEIRSRGKNYSADTLKKLRKRYHGEDYEFYFIAGTDVLNKIHSWHDSRYIIDTTKFVAIARKGHVLRKDSGLTIVLTIKGVKAVSSTLVLKKLMSGEGMTGLIPKAVERYILSKGLYSDKTNAEVCSSHKCR